MSVVKRERLSKMRQAAADPDGRSPAASRPPFSHFYNPGSRVMKEPGPQEAPRPETRGRPER